MHSRKIETEAVMNCRDLGGILNKDFRLIKKKKLLRSGALYKASENDLNRLCSDYHLTKVFDLRGEPELREIPDPQRAEYEVIWLPAMKPYGSSIEYDQAAIAKRRREMHERREKNPWQAREDMQNMYRGIAASTYSQQQYSKFLNDLLEENEGSYLWHCSMGKDRAGIATVFVLALLDVDYSSIVEDYLYTNQCVFLRYRDNEVNEDLKEMFIRDSVDAVNFEYLAAFMDVVNEQYGSLDDYIRNQLQIDDEKKQRFKDLYLE